MEIRIRVSVLGYPGRLISSLGAGGRPGTDSQDSPDAQDSISNQKMTQVSVVLDGLVELRAVQRIHIRMTIRAMCEARGGSMAFLYVSIKYIITYVYINITNSYGILLV